MKRKPSMFYECLLMKPNCKNSNDWKRAKNDVTDNDAYIPVIHPDAVNATLGTLLCTTISTLFLVVYLFCSK